MAEAKAETHRNFDVSLKLKAVEAAEKTSKAAAARQFKVDPKRIREWCVQKDKLILMKIDGKTKRKRMKGAGRRPMDEEMEEALFEWICEMRGRNLRVSRKMIKLKAKSLPGTRSQTGFKASNGWLRLFMKRKGLSLRRKTTVSQRTTSDVVPKLVSFVGHLRSLQIQHNFGHANVYAMDETACWMDMPGSTTINASGSRTVSLKTTGHEKDHFTVALSAKADGTKLKPFVVFKGKGTRLIKDLQKIPGIVVRFSGNGWFNDDLTCEYLHSIIGSFSFQKRLLIWDAYKCHTSTATRLETGRLRLHTAIIPGGCMSLIQAADVSWNAPFKSHMRSCYDTWLSEPSAQQFTKGGNMKAPSRSLLCEWVKSSWEAISSETIKKSFRTCAITLPLDGSQDEEIHCFKSGQPCAAGLPLLQAEMAKHQANTIIPDCNDPFASDSDGEEVEKNEACVVSEDEQIDTDGLSD